MYIALDSLGLCPLPMRRAAIQAFRTARRSHVRKVLFSKAFSTSLSNHARPRITAYQEGQLLPTLQSAMPRNFLLLATALVAGGGAWYYTGDPGSASSALSTTASPANTGASWAAVLGAFSSAHQSIPSSLTVEEPFAATRRALVVENDQFYLGEIPAGGPLSKANSDKLVLEMLTYEQALQKLKENEESFFVKRGQGVHRYDVVQLASNNPIEDDHVESIIKVPGASGATQGSASSSDWMFWGVFDGHRYSQMLLGHLTKLT